ncbi:MAG: hypothetical protein R3D30_06685 [Hyphomicrobiales bacterium]
MGEVPRIEAHLTLEYAAPEMGRRYWFQGRDAPAHITPAAAMTWMTTPKLPRGGEPRRERLPVARTRRYARERTRVPLKVGPDERGIDWSKVWTDFVYAAARRQKRIAWKHAGSPPMTVRAHTRDGWSVTMSPRPRGRGRLTAQRRAADGMSGARRPINRPFKMLDASEPIETRLKAEMRPRSADTERDMRTVTTIGAGVYAKLAALDDAGALAMARAGRETT